MSNIHIPFYVFWQQRAKIPKIRNLLVFPVQI